MKVNVRIMLKNGVLDPQGKAIEHALTGLGYDGVGEVRQGKIITIELPDNDNKEITKETVSKMCKELLSNPVIEDYEIEIL